MKLYMVRHGESEANLDYNIIKTKRDEDVELTSKGRQDAQATGLRLKATNIKAFYLVSPWVRAKQTWNIIKEVLGKDDEGHYKTAKETPLIAEHYMNLVNNPNNWELFQAYKASNWNVKDFLDTRYEGAESIRDVQKRAKKFLDAVKSTDAYTQKQGYDVVCICHGQFIKQVMCLVNNLDPDSVIHPANGEIVELDI